MKRRAYCCDASRDLYQEYYTRQNGGEIPVFAGARIQRGHGLGSILGGFFRRLVLPFFKNNGKRMLSNAVKTGMEVADDVLEGQSFKEAAKKRVPAGIKRTVQNLDWQSGSGVKRRRVGNKRRVKRRRKRDDLFS